MSVKNITRYFMAVLLILGLTVAPWQPAAASPQDDTYAKIKILSLVPVSYTHLRAHET